VDHFDNGETIRDALDDAAAAEDDRTAQRVLEAAVCELLAV
jgi:DNA topoisomerase-1